MLIVVLCYVGVSQVLSVSLKDLAAKTAGTKGAFSWGLAAIVLNVVCRFIKVGLIIIEIHFAF